LRGAKLQSVTFARVNLARVDLSGADLEGADLTGVDLTGALFKGVANLKTAALDNLRGANLAGLDVTGIDLSLLDLTGVVNLDQVAGVFVIPQSGLDAMVAAGKARALTLYAETNALRVGNRVVWKSQRNAGAYNGKWMITKVAKQREEDPQQRPGGQGWT
jgi:hypothetical protein